MREKSGRRRTIGAELSDGGVSFRVWAPAHTSVHVVLEDAGGHDEHRLKSDGDGYFAGIVGGLDAGTLYRYRLGDDRALYPDPASRFQPEGPHGPSMVIDPDVYAWHDRDWRGVDKKGLVIYELHVGTFTREGTWRAGAARLSELAEIGINLIEVMPVNEFPGRFGWGYDGVDIWAPTHNYGTPDDFRYFVDTAHSLRVGVILDVVYNHLGPDGCYLARFTPQYFTKKYWNEWGEAINFDGQGAAGMRELVAENAAYWVEEFHLDGLRIDATQSIFDSSSDNIIAVIARRAREAAKGRSLFLVAENEPQDVALLDRYGLDALWNDDWHHSAVVALTGRAEAYYTDYLGRPQEFISMAKYGFLYQGQWYSWQKQRRGTPSLHVPPQSLVCYLEDHDQVANSARGERLRQLTSPGRFRAVTALLLLQPQTPMLFQGQERGTRRPFLYFADHKPELAEAVTKGRRDFLSQFRSIDRGHLAAPADVATFDACKVDDESDDAIVRLHRDLIALRRGDATFASQRNDILHGAVLAPEAFLLRFNPDNAEGQRLLIINLGRDLHLESAPEPLLAPPRGYRWELLWSSEAPEYGGTGTAAVDTEEESWRIPGHAAVVLRPQHLS